MTLSYLELESHNNVVGLDWPRYDLMCRPPIVLHEEPKYKFEMSLVLPITCCVYYWYAFENLIFVMIWWYITLFSSILQYKSFAPATEVSAWESNSLLPNTTLSDHDESFFAETMWRCPECTCCTEHFMAFPLLKSNILSHFTIGFIVYETKIHWT